MEGEKEEEEESTVLVGRIGICQKNGKRVMFLSKKSTYKHVLFLVQYFTRPAYGAEGNFTFRVPLLISAESCNNVRERERESNFVNKSLFCIKLRIKLLSKEYQ